jgi:tetratricopeptide (TPR) repeat protein
VLFPVMTYMADRYLYAPSIGFCWMVAAAIVGWGELDRFPQLGRRGIAAMAATAAIVAGFTLQTLRHSGIWKDSESLWSFAVTKSEDYRVLDNLADVRIGQKRWDEAERMLKISARTENVAAYQSLGSLYCTEGRLDEALAATDRALEILSRQGHPSDPAADPSADLHYNRGAILWLKGNVPAAALEWQTALRENRGHALASQWLAIAERSLSRAARSSTEPSTPREKDVR